MDDSIIHILMFGAGMFTIGILVYALQKSGILTKIDNGDFWNNGQDKMQHNDVTF